MKDITFCYYFYNPDGQYFDMLRKSILSIREHYPNNPIFVCKTSDSEMGDCSGLNVQVFNTFFDGSHALGAMELLVRECKTKYFILLQDSMFLLRPLPETILSKHLYPLWTYHGPDGTDYDIVKYVAEINKNGKIKLDLVELYLNEYQKTWWTCFGPALGGTHHALSYLFQFMNINLENIHKFVGRQWIETLEKYLGLLMCGLNMFEPFEKTCSLNGNSADHPGCMGGIYVSATIEEMRELNPNSYFFKVWRSRK